jgi:hypothetical protein
MQLPEAHTRFSADLEVALRRLLGPENVVVQAAMLPMPEEPAAAAADMDAPPFPDPILDDYYPDDDVEPYYPAPPSPEPPSAKPAAIADSEDALVAARISGNLLPGEAPLPGIEARRSWWSNED